MSDGQSKISGIYRIVNTVTGDFYIGSSKDVHRRWREHRSELLRLMHFNSRLQRAWSKYGSEAFVFELLLSVDRADLIDAEQKILDAQFPSYNLSRIAGAPLGMRGRKFTEEHRRKIGDGNRGKKRSPEVCEAIRQSMLGTKKSALAIEKQRRAVRGMTRSAETREKIRQSLLGRKRPPEIYEKQQRTRLANLAARMAEAS